MQRVHRHGFAAVLGLLAIGAGLGWWRVGVIDVIGRTFEEASQEASASPSQP